jgi:glycosyltransferase involved in cell wall biosynthesis
MISVVIPTHNRAPQLKRVLDALVRDECPHKEIIVCDGASTDGTVDLLRSYGQRVRWISEPDKGEYDARNKGLSMASGEVIKYMSDDDELLSGALSYAARYFHVHPDVDILFGQSIWFDARWGREPVICDTRIRTAESITVRNFIRQSKPIVNSESAFFRRRVVNRIGFFNLQYLGADYEYWVRAAKAGLKLAISDQLFVHYNLSDLSGVERKKITLLFNSLRIAREHGALSDVLYVALVVIPYRIAVRIVSAALHSIGLFPENVWGRWKSRDTARLAKEGHIKNPAGGSFG